MACLHENTTQHEEHIGYDDGTEVVDLYLECLDCHEVFTPSEWDREQERLAEEWKRAGEEHAGDQAFHRFLEDQAA